MNHPVQPRPASAAAPGERFQLAATLRHAYGLRNTDLVPVDEGTATGNWSGSTTSGRRVFAKVYPANADLDAEEAAIALTAYANARGVATAQVIATTSGALLHRGASQTVSLWEHLPHTATAEAALAGPLWPEVGREVGTLHRVLAQHPAARPVQAPGHGVCDLDRAPRRFADAIGYYQHRRHPDDFDRWAARAARERLDLLPRVATHLEELPPLTVQVLHGDLASPNLLLDGSAIAGMVDFRPPLPRYALWEIARIACDPRSILADPHWLDGLARLLAAYHQANPDLPAVELVHTLRVAACTFATSTYPLTAPLNAQPLTARLRTYAQARHRAALLLLDHLDQAEEVLRAHLT
jgi:Ser/Thr protein kinase RdoA (MazF antagonist)